MSPIMEFGIKASVRPRPMSMKAPYSCRLRHLQSPIFAGLNKTPRKTFVESVHSTSSYPNQENRKRSASQSRTARTTLSNMFREQCIHHGITVYRASNADPKQNHQYSWIRLAEHLAIAGTAPSATSKNPTPGICFPSWPSI